jgi:hypothetical protein
MEGFDNSVAGGGNFALSQFRKVGRFSLASSLLKLTNIPYVNSTLAHGTSNRSRTKSVRRGRPGSASRPTAAS